ncbi:MAG: zf-HC2 domain-containing protein [Pseudodonghicola sp.]|nr:zf-HC2 domain-containing protein [Pseudodonghicola sp.]
MLTCRDLSHQADAFLDGELGLWDRLRIRLHLSMCNGCARFMGQMRTTRSLVRAEAVVAETGEDARIDSILAALHTKNPSDG